MTHGTGIFETAVHIGSDGTPTFSVNRVPVVTPPGQGKPAKTTKADLAKANKRVKAAKARAAAKKPKAPRRR